MFFRHFLFFCLCAYLIIEGDDNMPVASTKIQSTLVMECKTSIDAKGNDVLKSYSFNNIKMTSTDDELFNVSNTLASLLRYPVVKVLKTEQNLITAG